VVSVEDVHRPNLRIVWEKALELPRFEIPPAARIFARERWAGVPLIAGFRRGTGAVLWLAASPGPRGYERFPYILHALADLGLEPPFRSNRLWAFLDYAYRSRVDLDYFAGRWRRAGLAALHVSAWHFYDPEPERDRWLEQMIAACHREGLLVYAWLELPHVSEKFWDERPACREQTALLQDAHLDWRKLVNLADPECFAAAEAGVRRLVERFDWDGINVAELYFESLEGLANPSRFTPMNTRVREAFREASGFDPLDLFRDRHDASSRRAFLDFRAGLAHSLQRQWLEAMNLLRRERPHLDLVLTHVDDRFDAGMRDAIGADAARLLPLADRYDFTFLVEDPATVWHLGPERYPEIARRYRALRPSSGRLAVDLNIVERYQNVYPTKQQTGIELFQLVRNASLAFPRVALYFENAILAADAAWVSAASAVVRRCERAGRGFAVDSLYGVGIPWTGPALVDGVPWPVVGHSALWLPAGSHLVEPSAAKPPVRIVHFNGELRSARVLAGGAVEISYQSAARAIAVLDRRASRVLIDGAESELRTAGPLALLLPRGQHLVTVYAPD
jgi:hypothetical protein